MAIRNTRGKYMYLNGWFFSWNLKRKKINDYPDKGCLK
jgi:hypothetical protein